MTCQSIKDILIKCFDRKRKNKRPRACTKNSFCSHQLQSIYFLKCLKPSNLKTLKIEKFIWKYASRHDDSKWKMAIWEKWFSQYFFFILFTSSVFFYCLFIPQKLKLLLLHNWAVCMKSSGYQSSALIFWIQIRISKAAFSIQININS